jgi:hypothetical protein
MMRDKNAGQLLLLNSEAVMFAKQYDGNPARKYVAKQRYKRDVESRPRHVRLTRGVEWLVFRLRRNGKLGRRTRGRVWLYKWLCGESGLYHTGVTQKDRTVSVSRCRDALSGIVRVQPRRSQDETPLLLWKLRASKSWQCTPGTNFNSKDKHIFCDVQCTRQVKLFWDGVDGKARI